MLKSAWHVHGGSWVVIGDFNFVLCNEEKQGGLPLSQSQLDYYGILVGSVGLSDIKYSGNPFTWSNKRQGNDMILERLDRAFGNDIWFHFFENSIVYH